MNKINNLLKKLCPNGVEYMRLEELGFFYSGLNGKSKNDFKDGNKLYIPFKNIFSNISLNLKNLESVKINDDEKQNTILLGDILFTGSSETPNEVGMSSVVTKKIDFPVYLNSFCFGFRFKDLNLLNPDFSKYLFRCENLRKQIIKTASGVTRFNVSKKLMKNIKIPIPPLEIQNEISFILDRFTKLQYELQLELKSRKKQYEYYLNSMLAFSKDKPYCYPKINNLLKKLCPNGVEYMRLGEIGKVSMCKRIFKNQTKERGDIPFYKIGTFGKEANSFINKKIFNEYKIKYSYPKKGELLISASGTIGKVVIYDGEEAYYQDSNIVWIENKEEKILNKFLFYCYQNIKWENHFSKGGTIARLYNKNLKNLKIPIPPLEIQNEIVLILDKFNTLANDLNNGIPAEIELRKKQYEYYLNELLSFEEKKV